MTLEKPPRAEDQGDGQPENVRELEDPASDVPPPKTGAPNTGAAEREQGQDNTAERGDADGGVHPEESIS